MGRDTYTKVLDAVPRSLAERLPADLIAKAAGVDPADAGKHLRRATLRGEVVAVRPPKEIAKYWRPIKLDRGQS